MAREAQGKACGRGGCDVSAEMQPVRADLYGISGIRAGGSRSGKGHPSSGVCLHCGGHAASAGGPGDHGDDVPDGVRQCVRGSISDTVHAGEPGHQFLFSDDRQSGGRAGEPLCAGTEKSRRACGGIEKRGETRAGARAEKPRKIGTFLTVEL